MDLLLRMGPRIAGAWLQRSDRQDLDVQCALLLDHYSLPLVRKISAAGLGLNWNFCAAIRPARRTGSIRVYMDIPPYGCNLRQKKSLDQAASDFRPSLDNNSD